MPPLLFRDVSGEAFRFRKDSVLSAVQMCRREKILQEAAAGDDIGRFGRYLATPVNDISQLSKKTVG